MENVNRIKYLLKKNNISQKELAEIIGTTETSISRYVQGHRIPKLPIAIKMAKALHTTAEYIMDQETDDQETAYYRALRCAEQFSSEWTKDQKKALIDAILWQN
jgi:transcriptional regulator with XRE-family HTH domain